MRGLPWVVLVLVLPVLLATPARADADWEFGVSVADGRQSVLYGTEWYWGDPVLSGDMRYSDGGLYFGAHNDAWGARFRAGGRHADYNDRPGYRVFIPRGLEYPPEYYNGGPGYTQAPGTRVYHYGYYPYGYNQYGNNPYGNYGGVVYYPPAYYGPGSTVVIDNRYNDDRRFGHRSRRHERFYTASDYPELGYQGPVVYYDSAPPDYAGDGSEPQVYNDNRTYNYYYGDTAEEPAAQAQSDVEPAAPPPAPLVGPMLPDQQPAPGPDVQAGFRARGIRFYDQARVVTPAGEIACELVETALYAGPAGGDLAQLSANADPSFGAYLAFQPGAGVSVIYREGGAVMAAYPGTDGAWWQTALGLSVDFSQDVNLGLVGGAPWLVFQATDGRRYVYAFCDLAWQEIGSGS